MARLDFASLTPGRRRVLVTRLRQQARTTGDVNALVAYARRWLFDQHIIIPGQRALKELSARLLVEVERTLYLEELEAISEPVCEQWLQALYEEQPVYQIQLIDWLKTPPAKRSQSHLKELFARIAALKALDVHQYALPFPLERQRFYATRMRRRFPQRFRAMSPTRRTLELTCFLRVTLMDLVDTVLLQVEKRITELWSSARQTAERRRNERTVEDWTAVEAIHRALYDSTMSDRQARLAACAIINPLIERKPPPRAVLTREALLQESGIRSLLRALMALDFVAAPDHPGELALMKLRSLYTSGERELPADIGRLVPARWQPLIDDPDRRRALSAFEAATLYALRRGLKNGSIAVEYSISFRTPLCLKRSRC